MRTPASWQPATQVGDLMGMKGAAQAMGLSEHWGDSTGEASWVVKVKGS